MSHEWGKILMLLVQPLFANLAATAPLHDYGCAPQAIRSVNGGYLCYTVVPVRMSYGDAKAVCEVFGGKIATRWSSEDNKNIKVIATSLFSKADLKTTSAWAEDCKRVDLSNGRKESAKCTKTAPFICETATTLSSGSRARSPNAEIPSGWTQPNKFVYKLLRERLTWEEASKKCEQQKSKLATIQDAAENEYLAILAPNYAVWTGGKISKKASFYWYNNEQVSFDNLESAQPKKRSCVASRGGDWEMRSCNERLPAICKRNA